MSTLQILVLGSLSIIVETWKKVFRFIWMIPVALACAFSLWTNFYITIAAVLICLLALLIAHSFFAFRIHRDDDT